MLIEQDVKTKFKLLFLLGYIIFEKYKLQNCIDYHSMDYTLVKCLDFNLMRKCCIFSMVSLNCRLCEGVEEQIPKAWAL